MTLHPTLQKFKDRFKLILNKDSTIEIIEGHQTLKDTPERKEVNVYHLMILVDNIKDNKHYSFRLRHNYLNEVDSNRVIQDLINTSLKEFLYGIFITEDVDMIENRSGNTIHMDSICNFIK